MALINPLTNRPVKVGTRAYKNLLKDFDMNGSILVPKNKTGWSYSTIKNAWMQDSKLPKHYESINNQVIMNRDEVRLPTGRYVKLASSAFQKYKRLGYKLDGNDLYIPSTHKVEGVDAADNVDLLNSPGSTFVKFTNKETGETELVRYSSAHSVIDAFFLFMYAHEIQPYSVEIEFYDKPMNEIKFGPMYDGQMNCLLKLISEHDTRCNLSKIVKNLHYDGVFEEDLSTITDECKLCIHIHTNSTIHKYGSKYTKNKPILHVKLVGNHAILYTPPKDKTIVYGIPTVDINDIENIKTGRDGTIKAIITGEHVYKYEFDCGIKLEDDQFSILDVAFADFKNYFSRPLRQCYLNIPNFTNPIMYQNRHMKLNHTYKMIDLKSAYSHLPSKLPADIVQCVDTTTKLDVPYAFYLCSFIHPLTNEPTFQFLSEDFVNVFDKHNISYKIKQALISSNTTEFNTEFIAKWSKVDKRMFHKVIGMCQINKGSHTFTTTNPEEAWSFGGYAIDVQGQTVYKCHENEHFSAGCYYPHFAAAITQYTSAILLDTILTNKLKPLRVWVDSIVVDKITYTDDRYSIKSKSYSSMSSSCMTNNPYCDATEYVKLPEADISVITGPAGSGKTTMMKKILKNIPSSFVIASSHMAVSNYDEFDNRNTIAAYLVMLSKRSNTTTVLIIDEMSMVSAETLKKLQSTAKIILVGDKNQIKCVEGTPIDYTKYPITELTTVYRQTDASFLSDIEGMKTSTNLNWITQTATVEESIKSEKIVLSMVNSEVDRINKAAYSMIYEEPINDKLKIGMRIMITTNAYKKKGIFNGQLGRLMDNVSTAKRSKCHVKLDNGIEADIPTSSIVPAYSITCHKLQGQTVMSDLVINTEGIRKFECVRNMLYTAVSRVRERRQLYLLNQLDI